MRRLTILIAAVGALMLVPAASAFAAEPKTTVNITGPGSGEVTDGSGEQSLGHTTPSLACTYNGESKSGVCEGTPEEPSEGSGFFTSGFTAHPAPGSEFGGWTVQKGINIEGNGLVCPMKVGFAPQPGPNPAAECFLENLDPEYPGEVEGPEFEVLATFCTEGTAIEEVVFNALWEENETKLVGCEEVTPPAGPPLTLNIEEGSGTVVSNPAGIECTGAAPKACTTEEIAEGETVTLTASPAAGFLFKGWKKCDKGGVAGRQCTVTLSEAKEVGAKFTPSFDVTLENSGGGKVYSKPGGALCLPNCSETTASFKAGKPVEVLTKPNKHFHLVEFGGDCSGTTCSGLEANSTVSATFAEDPTQTLSLAKEGGGQGFIKAKPAGLNCTYTCSGQEVDYYEGEALSIEVKLGKGTSGVEWTTPAGTCTGSALTCTVTMSSAKSLVAKFE